jgi:acetylglutamate kinase
MLTVLKLGGELLEDRAALESAAGAIVRLARRDQLVVVHGGGRAIDAELKARGLTPRFVDGLRVTDEAALDAVLSVLAGRTNTALVAAIGAAGGRAVGLTGADGSIGLSTRAPLFTTVSREQVDLGLVGQPHGDDVTLIGDLLRLHYTPVIASIGVSARGELLNVNADTFAGHLAAVVKADRLIVAGGTAGVLDGANRTIAALTAQEIDEMIESGGAHSGMVAKLAACRRALDGGVRDVSIVSGRGAQDFTVSAGTCIRDEQSVAHAPRSAVRTRTSGL